MLPEISHSVRFCISPHPSAAACSSGRTFCTAVQMLPALTTLTLSIGALAYAILWNMSLAIVGLCGMSVIAGIVLTWQGWNYHNLATFEESNSRLAVSVEELGVHNNQLKAKLETFEENNLQLESSVKDLDSQNKNMKDNLMIVESENCKLKTSIEELRKTACEFEQLKKIWEEKTNVQVNQLEEMVFSLQNIENAAEEDHQNFANHLEKFGQKVTLLNQIDQNLVATSEKLDQKMDCFLSKTALSINTIFRKMHEWMNLDKKLNEKIDSYKKMQEMVTQQNQSLLEQLKLISENEGKLEQLKQSVGELKKLKGEFRDELDRLKNEVNRMSNINNASEN